jgi:hypothetical protein
MEMQLVERIFGGGGGFRVLSGLRYGYHSRFLRTCSKMEEPKKEDEINASSRRVLRGNDIQIIPWAFSNFNDFNSFCTSHKFQFPPHRSCFRYTGYTGVNWSSEQSTIVLAFF